MRSSLWWYDGFIRGSATPAGPPLPFSEHPGPFLPGEGVVAMGAGDTGGGAPRTVSGGDLIQTLFWWRPSCGHRVVLCGFG